MDRKYEQYHGLVVVHPDFSRRSKHPQYLENLIGALDCFYSAGKPIFVARDVVARSDSRIWQELWRVRARTLPVVNPSDGIFPSVEEFLRQSQREVDSIVVSVAMPRASIRLAFGGLNAEQCVYAFATAYCREVETSYPGDNREPLAKNPIGYGKVFDEIV